MLVCTVSLYSSASSSAFTFKTRLNLQSCKVIRPDSESACFKSEVSTCISPASLGDWTKLVLCLDCQPSCMVRYNVPHQVTNKEVGIQPRHQLSLTGRPLTDRPTEAQQGGGGDYMCPRYAQHVLPDMDQTMSKVDIRYHAGSTSNQHLHMREEESSRARSCNVACAYVSRP